MAHGLTGLCRCSSSSSSSSSCRLLSRFRRAAAGCSLLVLLLLEQREVVGLVCCIADAATAQLTTADPREATAYHKRRPAIVGCASYLLCRSPVPSSVRACRCVLLSLPSSPLFNPSQFSTASILPPIFLKHGAPLLFHILQTPTNAHAIHHTSSQPDRATGTTLTRATHTVIPSPTENRPCRNEAAWLRRCAPRH